MFITSADLNTSIYPEIRQAISRGQETIVDHHINEALSYIESRLRAKYDITAEFEKTGTDRHPLLLKYTKDIAVYYLYDLPETIPAKRVKAYEDAVKWLDDVVRGYAVLAGVAPAPEDDNTSGQKFGNITLESESKRDNFF